MNTRDVVKDIIMMSETDEKQFRENFGLSRQAYYDFKNRDGQMQIGKFKDYLRYLNAELYLIKGKSKVKVTDVREWILPAILEEDFLDCEDVAKITGYRSRDLAYACRGDNMATEKYLCICAQLGWKLIVEWNETTYEVE